ncbi:MAG: Rab family GTPase [Candidatus Thorarchaeota archaeon]
MNTLRVPGTTVTIALLPGYVELRDRGIIKKKIRIKSKGFTDVLDEINQYFKIRSKRLPPGVLKDTLVRIGVPEARKILTSETIEETKKPEPEVVPVSTPSIDLEKDLTVETPISDESAPTLLEEITSSAATNEPIVESSSDNKSSRDDTVQISSGEPAVLKESDYTDIEEALSVVESISDTFMAPRVDLTEEPPSTKQGIRINLDGFEEVTASNRSTATTPTVTISTKSDVIVETKTDETKAAETIDESSTIDEANRVETSADSSQPIEHEVVTEEPDQSELTSDEPVSDDSDISMTLEDKTKPVIKPKHTIKELIEAKIVLLGEEGVGKLSLMEKAGLRIQEPDETGKLNFIRTGIMKVLNHRVNIKVWSFDEAAKSKIPRGDFYKSTDIAIIVYAISDRWSFESIEFWLKEAVASTDELPPIVLVANKKDIRDTHDSDPLEPPVTQEEGFSLAERIAQVLGEENKLHQVAFIETSCLTGEGVESVFNTAAELHSNTL